MVPTQPAPDASSLRPWQFFTLLALLSATAAVIIIRGSSPANVILTCLAIGAAGLVGGAALRMLKPLISLDAFEADMVGSRTRAALEREKNLVLRSIKELEFDHAMAKVSDADFEEMTARLRSRAVGLMKQLDSTETGYREIIERELAARLAKTPVAQGFSPGEAKAEALGHQSEAAAQGFSPGTCGACETSNGPDAKFCKQCGARLLIAIMAILALAGSVWAQGGGIQMPDPKTMSGIPRPVTDLPDGHISVRLIRGQLSNNITESPVELHAGGKVVTVKTDENGRAEFSGIKNGTAVTAVATVDGERLESQEFPVPSQGGIRLMLVATLKGAAAAPALQPQKGMVVFGDQTRVIVELADDTLQIYYLLDVQNSARAPVNPASALILDVPGEAQGTELLGGGPALVAGNRVTLTGPFPSGQTPLQVGYQLPYSGGDVTVTQKLPASTGSLAVLLKKVGDMSLTSPQFPQIEERTFEGENYILAQAPPQAAGTTLTLHISGLPHHSGAPRLIALLLACSIAGIGIWAAIKVPRRGVDAARLKQLKGKREKIFADLIRLEQQRRTGAVDASRFADRRQVLMAQLERVYRDLDTEGGQGLAA